MNTADVPYLVALKIVSPAFAGAADNAHFRATMVTSDGVEFPCLFASVVSLRGFIRDMTPERVELVCLPEERDYLERAIREHPLLH